MPSRQSAPRSASDTRRTGNRVRAAGVVRAVLLLTQDRSASHAAEAEAPRRGFVTVEQELLGPPREVTASVVVVSCVDRDGIVVAVRWSVEPPR